jgi:hypothetical protein
MKSLFLRGAGRAGSFRVCLPDDLVSEANAQLYDARIVRLIGDRAKCCRGRNVGTQAVKQRRVRLLRRLDVACPFFFGEAGFLLLGHFRPMADF